MRRDGPIWRSRDTAFPSAAWRGWLHSSMVSGRALRPRTKRRPRRKRPPSSTSPPPEITTSPPWTPQTLWIDSWGAPAGALPGIPQIASAMARTESGGKGRMASAPSARLELRLHFHLGGHRVGDVALLVGLGHQAHRAVAVRGGADGDARLQAHGGHPHLPVRALLDLPRRLIAVLE